MMPEFSAQVLDSLRQPLESGEAVISRANRHVKYPSRFQLIAAANPCKCGGGPAEALCRKKPGCMAAYMGRISGPFLDRIDLFVDTPAVTAVDLAGPPPQEGTSEVSARVAIARNIQLERFKDIEQGRRQTNADASSADIDRYCSLSSDGKDLIEQAAVKMNLSARAYHRVLKVARTIADLDRANDIERAHLAEALTYRFRQPGQIAEMSAKTSTSYMRS